MNTSIEGVMLIVNEDGSVYGFARKDPATHLTRLYRCQEDMSLDDVAGMFNPPKNI